MASGKVFDLVAWRRVIEEAADPDYGAELWDWMKREEAEAEAEALVEAERERKKAEAARIGLARWEAERG